MRGTLLNTATVVVGTTVGVVAGRGIPPAYEDVGIHGIALVAFGVGIKMVIGTKNPLVVVAAMSLGGIIGLALGAAVCLLTYFGLMRIPQRALFATTTILITLLAAGMAAQAVAFLERANWLTSLDTVVWDSAWLLSEASIAGRTMHTLVGYTDQPTQMQLLVYVAVLVVTVMLMRLTGSQHNGRAIAAG